jgi:hypothetical protein
MDERFDEFFILALDGGNWLASSLSRFYSTLNLYYMRSIGLEFQ